MNKEAVVAILIGVGLGLFGAVFFSNFGKSFVSTNTGAGNTLKTIGLTPRPTIKTAALASFSKLPENNALLTSDGFYIEGKADSSSRLLLANQLELTPLKIVKSNFRYWLKLKPGANKIVFLELNQDKEQLKVLKVFYLQLPGGNLKTDKKEATKEADLLKEKLEDKVSGEIKSVSGKTVTMANGAGVEKIMVEPEITNFFRVNGYSLEPIEFEALKAGQNMTAFISDIGGEQISYTVYQEPDLNVAVGKISNIDDKNYKLTLVDYDKSSFGVDIQTDTTQRLYNLKSGRVEKAGFSKLAIGQRFLTILSGSKGSYSAYEYLAIE